MAGDWIKVEKATARKPEILRLAVILGMHVDQAFGLCVRFWSWCDDNLSSGNASGVTEALLDALLGQPGIASALIEVGWLQVRQGSLAIPNFDRHLSKSAKSRALSARRTALHRSRSSNGASVTKTLPEKRREEKKRPPKPPNGGEVASDPLKESGIEFQGLPDALDDSNFRESWLMYEAHRRTTPKGCVQLIERVQNFVQLAAIGPERAAEVCRLAVGKGWSSLVFDAKELSKPKAADSKKSDDITAEYAAINQKNSDPQTRANVQRVIEEAKKARRVS